MDHSSPSSADEIIAALTQETYARRVRTRNLRLVTAILLFITVVGAIINIASGRPFDWITLVPLFAITAAISMGLDSRHRQLSSAASHINDTRVVGSLIEVLDCGDRSLVATVESALTPLLRAISLDDELEDHQLDRLASALSKTQNRRFFSAGVDALARIGTTRCLHALDAMVAIPPSGLKSQSAAENIARKGAADLRLRLSRLRFQVQPEREAATNDSIVLK